MAAQQSNLTSIGYNLSCATTQNAINATMQYYLSTLDGSINWYNIYNRTAQATETVTSEQFAQICPVDPTTVPNGTSAAVGGLDLTQDQQNLVALYQAGFQYGIQAATGIDATWSTTPNVVELAQLGTVVTYNMFFATMQVVQVQENYGILKMVNCAQPSNAPWLFGYQANLSLADVTGAPGTPPPQDELFSVQQLYLDLNTVINGTIPSISADLTPECMAFVTAYVDAYVKSIPAGQSTVSYTQTYVPNNNPPPSLYVTSLQYAAVPYGADPGLSTLNYLCMSEDNARPANIVYPQWNWVEPGAQVSGVMAVERQVFASYLLNIFNANFQGFSAQTYAHAKYKDNGFDSCKEEGVDFSYVTAPDPGMWIANPDTTSSVIATASYSHDSGNTHKFTDICKVVDGSISCYWNYSLNATLSYSNDANGVAHILLNLAISSPVHVHFCGKTHDADSANITAVIDYAITVSPIGELIINAVATNTNQSQTISNVETSCGTVHTGVCNEMSTQLYNALLAQLSAYEGAVLQALQGATAWYFPGSSSFAFKNAAFSTYGDLTVDLLYGDPSSAGAGNPGAAGQTVAA